MERVAVDAALDRTYPERVTLLVVPDAGGANVMTAAWVTRTSFDPPMLAASVGNGRYTPDLLADASGFVVAFPSVAQRAAVHFCGTRSGETHRKFAETSLERAPPAVVDAPLVAESVACYECEPAGAPVTGDHTLFAGEVVAGHVSAAERKCYHFGGFRERGVVSLGAVERADGVDGTPGRD
ncbi:MAG: flavin reductase family protein [Halobacteriaceae archaeon]